MRKFSFFVFPVLFLLMSVQAFAQQDFEGYFIVNKTGVVIDQLNLSAANTDEWGGDILGVDVLPSESECEIVFSPNEDQCLWDLRIMDSEGNAIVWFDIDLCKYSVITLFWDGETATATFE
ncbi:hypothetical protein BAC3_01583 [uncultured bacterium]|nr:hypothetical protein BAC3_01583 [uncultured bacterium]